MLCLACLTCGATAPSEDKASTTVLLTYGGHGFDQEPFFEMFDHMPGVAYTRAPMPESAGLLKPGLEEEYDVIVMYDMVKSISPEQQASFAALLERGIGLVSLHHNLCAHRDWDAFRGIIGGKYLFAAGTIDGSSHQASGFAHGQEITVTIADPDHAITRGLKDFSIHDEVYKDYYTSPDAHILLTTDHRESDQEIAWTFRYGRSPVFYLLLGHDARAWRNPVYPRLLLNGIRWAGDQRGRE